MNSPAQRNPKNPVHAAAQSNVPSGLVRVANHIAFSCWNISMVIGRRDFGAALVCASDLFTPASTYSRRGRLPTKGLPRSWWICANLRPDR